VVVVLIVGFFAYKTFFSNPNETPYTMQDEKHRQEMNAQSATAKRLAGQTRGTQNAGQTTAPGSR
jgi:hypothetical protein